MITINFLPWRKKQAKNRIIKLLIILLVNIVILCFFCFLAYLYSNHDLIKLIDLNNSLQKSFNSQSFSKIEAKKTKKEHQKIIDRLRILYEIKISQKRIILFNSVVIKQSNHRVNIDKAQLKKAKGMIEGHCKNRHLLNWIVKRSMHMMSKQKPTLTFKNSFQNIKSNNIRFVLTSNFDYGAGAIH